MMRDVAMLNFAATVGIGLAVWRLWRRSNMSESQTAALSAQVKANAEAAAADAALAVKRDAVAHKAFDDIQARLEAIQNSPAPATDDPVVVANLTAALEAIATYRTDVAALDADRTVPPADEATGEPESDTATTDPQ